MATMPTVLYYLSAFLMIEADARRWARARWPSRRRRCGALTRRYGYHFLSLFAVAG